jgi:hypothetical protein
MGPDDVPQWWRYSPFLAQRARGPPAKMSPTSRARSSGDCAWTAAACSSTDRAFQRQLQASVTPLLRLLPCASRPALARGGPAHRMQCGSRCCVLRSYRPRSLPLLAMPRSPARPLVSLYFCHPRPVNAFTGRTPAGVMSLRELIERGDIRATAAGSLSGGYRTSGAVSSIRPERKSGNTAHENPRGAAGGLS